MAATLKSMSVHVCFWGASNQHIGAGVPSRHCGAAPAKEAGMEESSACEGITHVGQQPPSNSADWTRLQCDCLQVTAAMHAACLHTGMTGRQHSLLSQQQAVRLQVCHGMHPQTRAQSPCTWSAPVQHPSPGVCRAVAAVSNNPAAPFKEARYCSHAAAALAVKQCSSSLPQW